MTAFVIIIIAVIRTISVIYGVNFAPFSFSLLILLEFEMNEEIANIAINITNIITKTFNPSSDGIDMKKRIPPTPIKANEKSIKEYYYYRY